MQGIFVKGSRPTSKKQVKEALAADPSSVRIEATSAFGNEYDGLASELPATAKLPIMFVGPDPYTRRNFYGQIKRNRAGDLVVT
jgi:hypothetical protein